MSKKQAISFFKEVAKNKQLAEKVSEVVGGQANNQAKAAKILSLAKKNHFNFTTEDAASAKDELKTALQIEDLSEVSGGRNKAMSAFMALSLLTGGLGITESKTNVESSAMFGRFGGGGKGSGSPAPTGKKGDDKDEEQPGTADLEQMTKEQLVQTVLRMQTQLTQSQMRGRERGRSQLSSPSMIANTTEINVQDEVRKMEIQRLKDELARTQKVVDSMSEVAGNNLVSMTKIQKENEELKESNAKLLEESKQRGVASNSTDYERIQQLEEENRALQEEQAALEEQVIRLNQQMMEQGKQTNKAEPNFGGGAQEVIDGLVAEIKELKDRLKKMAEAPQIDFSNQLKDVEAKYLNIQMDTAKEADQLRKEAVEERVNREIYYKLYRKAKMKEIHKQLAMCIPPFVSVAIKKIGGRLTLVYTVYEDDFDKVSHENGLMLPMLRYDRSIDDTNLNDYFLVTQHGLSASDGDSIKHWDEDEEQISHRVLTLTDAVSIGPDVPLDVQVVRAPGSAPRNGVSRNIFSTDISSPLFGLYLYPQSDVHWGSRQTDEGLWDNLMRYMAAVVPPYAEDLLTDNPDSIFFEPNRRRGERMAPENEYINMVREQTFETGVSNQYNRILDETDEQTKTKKKDTLSPKEQKALKEKLVRNAKQRTEKQTQAAEAAGTNSNNNLNNLNNNNNDEISDTDMLAQDSTQTMETQQQSNNRTQRTYTLNGRTVPVHQYEYSMGDLYQHNGVTLSDDGAAPVIYSPSEVVSGNLFAGPGNNSVVEFRATDSYLYNVNPDTGDVTANFVFDPQYRGYTTSLRSAVGFLANLARPADAIQLSENAPNIFNGLGLVGANGKRGKFIVNVRFG